MFIPGVSVMNLLSPLRMPRHAMRIACLGLFCGLSFAFADDPKGPAPKEAPKTEKTGESEEPRKPTQFPNAGKDPSVPIPEEETVRLDQELEFFKYIEDDAPLALRGSKIHDPKKEMAANLELRAYDYVLAFASKQSKEVLARHSLKKIGFADLYKPIRQDYLRELMHFEGRLSLVTPFVPTTELKDLEKIKKLYECWITPKGQNEYLCVVVSELPPGIEPGEDLNRWVSFDAYYFKLWHYETRQKKGETGKNIWRKAPLFLGKSINDLGPINVDAAPYSSSMLTGIVAGIAALAGLVIAIAFWFKRGDRAVKAASVRKIQENSNLESL
jgi:hypothetical protein